MPEDEISRMHRVSLHEHVGAGFMQESQYNKAGRSKWKEGNGSERKRCATPVEMGFGTRRELPWTVLCIPNAYRAIPMHRMHEQLIYSRNKPPSFSINRKFAPCSLHSRKFPIVLKTFPLSTFSAPSRA